MTANEKIIHERAVKLCNMTDEQPCNFINRNNSVGQSLAVSIDELLTEAKSVKGVGLRIIQRLRNFAVEKKYITEG